MNRMESGSKELRSSWGMDCDVKIGSLSTFTEVVPSLEEMSDGS